MLISAIFRILEALILVRVLISWFPVDQYHPAVRLINKLTEPLLAPIRNILPRGNLPIDFSPFVFLILLSIVESLVKTIFKFY